MKVRPEYQELINAINQASELFRHDDKDCPIANRLDMALVQFQEFASLASRDALMLSPRREFGNVRVYPQCEKSRALASFASCKSFTIEQLQTLSDLGYELSFVYDQTEFQELFSIGAKNKGGKS